MGSLTTPLKDQRQGHSDLVKEPNYMEPISYEIKYRRSNCTIKLGRPFV